MVYSQKEMELRRSVQAEYDFWKHCRTCPQHINCCTRQSNVVVVREAERPVLMERHSTLRAEGLVPSRVEPEFEELTDTPGMSTVVLLEDGSCPFFTKHGKCGVHDVKPLDCVFWPLTFRSDGGDATLLDVQCPASRSGEMPASLLEVDRQLAQITTTAERTAYARLNSDSYEDRLVEVTALGLIRTESILANWEKRRARTSKRLERIWRQEEKLYARVERWFDHRLHAKDVVRWIRWLIAIALALILEGSITTSHRALFPEASTFLPNVVVVLFLVMLLADAIRLLIPLPWIFIEILEDDEYPERNPKPTRQHVVKTVLIAAITFILLYFAAQSLNYPGGYFLFLFLAQAADFLWYKPIVFPKARAAKLHQKSDKVLESFESEMRGFKDKISDREVKAGGFDQKMAVMGQLDAFFQVEERSLRKEVEELGMSSEERRLLLEAEHQGNLQDLGEVVKKQSRDGWFVWIAAADAVFCALFVLAALLEFGRIDIPHTEMYDAVQGGWGWWLWGMSLMCALHVGNIVVDYWRNSKDYLRYVWVMAVKAGRGIGSAEG